MTTFSTVLGGKVITIVVVESSGTQKFKLKENGSWKEISAGQAFSMLRKALEQGNTIEYYHESYDPNTGDIRPFYEPIQTLDKLLEVWYV